MRVVVPGVCVAFPEVDCEVAPREVVLLVDEDWLPVLSVVVAAADDVPDEDEPVPYLRRLYSLMFSRLSRAEVSDSRKSRCDCAVISRWRSMSSCVGA